MGDIFRCGDNAALVDYLYDEADAGERAAIAAHLAICSKCATEVSDLSATRQQLSAWRPPETELDFRLTSGAAVPPARWWSNPLPAWAQLAAAAAIFAFGLALGTAATSSSDLATTTLQVDDSAITQAELARLEKRVQEVERRSVTAVPVAMDDTSQRAMAAWVLQEIRESENRNLDLLAQTIININRDRRPEVIEATAPMGFVPAEIGGARFGQRREE
jgi:anti-sigma factor RsiW